MRLYYSPGACSLSVHIALNEAGLPAEYEKVNLRTKLLGSGGSYLDVNPKGYVPALRADDGALVTEAPVVLQYVADLKPGSGLAPAAGSPDRYKVQEWLSFVNSELHKHFTPLFMPNTPDAWKQVMKDMLAKRFEIVSKALQDQPFLTGETFTVADAYLFVTLTWTGHVGVDLDQWPVLKAYADRIAARPAVQKSMKEEGLLK